MQFIGATLLVCERLGCEPPLASGPAASRCVAGIFFPHADTSRWRGLQLHVAMSTWRASASGFGCEPYGERPELRALHPHRARFAVISSPFAGAVLRSERPPAASLAASGLG